ncbi:MAG: hypothetical protein ACRCVJ_18705 [Clostridium sp.]|uniref:hypothetical protein n=1 Tax=Clostridium sp. TaxID=1506 RepID=UPI003F3D390F
MHNIEIVGKLEMTTLSCKDLEEDYIVISINNTNDTTKIYKNEKIKAVHKVVFDDIERPINNLKTMDIGQAKDIKEFVDKYKDSIKRIYCQCTAGISRSSAVATVIARYLNKDDNYIWFTGKYSPNKHVYKTMCVGFGIDYSEQLWKSKQKIAGKGALDKNIKIYSDYGVSLEDMFN